MLYPGDISSDPSATPEQPISKTHDMLRQTRPWVKFLGVLGFVGCGLMILLGVIAGMIGLAGGQPQMLVFFFIYPLMGVLCYFPSLFLVRYAARINEFLSEGLQAQLDFALEAQKKYWKFMGILALVGLCLEALFIVLGIAFAVIAALAGH